METTGKREVRDIGRGEVKKQMGKEAMCVCVRVRSRGKEKTIFGATESHEKAGERNQYMV